MRYWLIEYFCAALIPFRYVFYTHWIMLDGFSPSDSQPMHHFRWLCSFFVIGSMLIMSSDDDKTVVDCGIEHRVFCNEIDENDRQIVVLTHWVLMCCSINEYIDTALKSAHTCLVMRIQDTDPEFRGDLASLLSTTDCSLQGRLSWVLAESSQRKPRFPHSKH